MNFEVNRLVSFRGDWKGSRRFADDLAKDGFYYLGWSDAVKCNFCGIQLHSWQPGDSVVMEHLKYNQWCAPGFSSRMENIPLIIPNNLT